MTDQIQSQWHPVEKSSNVLGYSYHPVNKTLTVEFKGNSKYDYHNVPQADFDAFHTSESKGSHLHGNIKNKYEAKKHTK